MDLTKPPASLLEGFGLRALGHNTAEYLHVYLECAKLAFADRERYYADPAFVDVPLGRLLSEDYAAERRALVDPRRASLEQRAGVVAVTPAPAERWPVVTGDTTHIDVVDRWGNLFAATPSGGWIGSSPVVEGLGFPLGTRGQMFYLDERHPNSLAPGKRPRTTLTPSLALRDVADVVESHQRLRRERCSGGEPGSGRAPGRFSGWATR